LSAERRARGLPVWIGLVSAKSLDTMTAELSHRTTKEEAVDHDLKGLQHETSIYDITQTGEVLSAVDDKKLRFKIDCRLMPILCITYALQSIDKTTLSYAAVFGLADETHVSGPEFSWLGAIFYLGYMFWEWPTSYLLQRFPLAKFLGTSVSAWKEIPVLNRH